MLRILTQEDGFEIKHRELMRVRARNRWLLRTPSTERLSIDDLASGENNDDDDTATSNNAVSSSQKEPYEEAEEEKEEEDGAQYVVEQERGASRVQYVRAGPAEERTSRKKRRRDRVRSRLVTDSTAQPRFPSETTIDESRATLNLDAKLYQGVRTLFAQICNEEGVQKKTTAGAARWEVIKSRLVQTLPHLQAIMWMSEDNIQGKKLALDVICTDVTKRLRSMKQKLTIADAKNLLGINPEEYRGIRHDLVDSLNGDDPASKTETGPEHWETTKEKWRNESAILQRLFAGSTTDSTYTEKLRALDVVARDVMKRLRDGQTKQKFQRKRAPAAEKPSISQNDIRVVLENRDMELSTPDSPHGNEMKKVSADKELNAPTPLRYSHGSSPMSTSSTNMSSLQLGQSLSVVHLREHFQRSRPAMHRSTLPSTGPDGAGLRHNSIHSQTSMLSEAVLSSALPIDPQIDGALPMLLDSDNQPLESQHAHAPFHLTSDMSPSVAQSPHSYVQDPYGSPMTPRPPVAVYLRLHPSSAMAIAPSVWIATLTARTFEELRHVAVKDLPGMVCGRIEGILGQNMTIVVSKDDELTAYLTVLEGRNSTGSPPCFFVQILPGVWKA